MAKDTISYEDAFGLTSTPAAPSAGTVSYEEAFGLPPTPPKRRTLAAIANDTVIEAANAAAGGVSAAANFVRPGNAVSGWIDKNIVQVGEASQSDAVKAEKQRFRQGVANADGVMDELGAVGSYVVNNPVLSAAQAVGSFVGPGLAVKGGRTLASIAGLNAARGGLAGGAAAGAAMAGGDAAGAAYELSTKAGATDEQAVAAGRGASVLPAVIGGVGGVVGAERLVAGAKGFAGNAASRALKTGAVEGAQEAIEEGVTQYEGQRAAMPFDATIDPSKGVAAAAGMGAALGAATGGGVSLLTGGQQQQAPAAATVNADDPSVGAAAAPAQPAVPAIDPNAGPLSKAASLAGDLGLAPTPAEPTAQEQRATLEAAISRLPEAQQREARLNLADLDNQSLPAGVRAMRDARLQDLVGGAPAAPVELTPQDMERGRVLPNFDARSDDAPPERLSLAPEQDQAPVDGLDFPAPTAPEGQVNPDAARVAELALAADLAPGEPMQLNRAHALRRAAAAEGIAISVIPHPSGRGYDVAPTARLDPAARAAMPQDEAAAMLPFDQSPSGRMLASQDGSVRAETRPEAVALSNEATAQLQQVEGERQRRTDLGMSNITPVVPVTETGNSALPQVTFDNAPTGRMVAGADGVRPELGAEVVNRANQPARAPQTVASDSGAPFESRQVAQQALQQQQLAGTHEVVPAGGDETLGFVLKEKGSAPVPQQMRGNPTFEGPASRAPNWRTNAMQANRIARGLGIETTGKRLPQVVAEIEAAADSAAKGNMASIPTASTMSSTGAASTTVPITLNATEFVAAGADESSAGRTSVAPKMGGQLQDRPPRSGPLPETGGNQVPTLVQEAPEAMKSGADSAPAGPRPARAAAPRSTTRMEEVGSTRSDGEGLGVLFSSSDQVVPARGLSPEEAQQAVQEALAGLANPPPIDIVTRSQELGVDAPDGVMGAAIPGEGRIVIVASAHGSADAVAETVFHEMFHLGLRNVLPAPDYVQAMLDLAKRDTRVQEFANRWKREAADAPQQLQALRDLGHAGSELTARYEALAIEEGLAVVAQELRAQKQAGTRLGLRVRALASWLASVADRMGMGRLAERIRKMTYTEAERFVLKAIDQSGTPAPVAGTGGDITRFRTQGENSLAGRVGETLKGVTITDLKKQAGFKATDYRGLGLQLLGRRQLVDVYGDMLPEMRRYSDLMARMDADKNEAGSGADQLAQDWAKLPDERALAELMHDSTLAQIDPSKDFVEGDNKTDWTKLQARYNTLTPGAKDVYARARDTYRQHMRDVRSAIKERIERTEISSERKAAMLKRMDDEFFGHIKGVYFPLARFGQYVVVVKDADGKVANVSRAETMAEADATRGQLQRAFPSSKGFSVGKVLKAKDFVAERDSVGRGFMEQLYGVLDKQGMDTKQRAELEDALGQLYLSSLPDLSWAKHGIHRKGTAGFSQDARRAFAQNVFHGASYLAKLRYGDRLQDELGEMQRRVDAGSTDSGFDSVKAQQVVDEMVKRHDAAMNPKTNAVSTALTSLGFIFHLGLSPASAMVNLTQTALVAYPVMGAKWGFKKASAALLKASGEAARGKNDITGSLSAEEKAAFDEAVRSGVIDVTMAHDLAGIAQGEDQNVSYKLRPVMRAASWMFHHAEKFNRQITFVAAYRLAREAGAGDKAAYEQAVQATYDGHFDYSSNNRPRAMQGNVARVVLLFKQYGQNMVYTLVRNAQQSLKGASPQDRAQARKALGGLLVMHGLAAGALGLPMVTTLLAAASMLGGDDDEPWDAQVALQNMLADTFGQKPAEVMAHGLSRLTPWDISGRVGLDKLIFPDVQEGLEGQRLGESAMAAALGPVAGIGINVLKGLQDMGDGRYLRGLEAMAPAVLRGPLKSFRYGTEGVRDKSGIVVQDEVGAAELLGQASGFSPSSVRNSFEGKSAIVQQDRSLMARRSALVEQFAMAAMAGDEEGKSEAREAIARFNEKNPNRRIQAMQLAQSVNMRQKRIREAQEGVYLPGKRRDALEAGRFAVLD
ncbi:MULTISPECIES: PLxRFG domain-containing protein [unclassified Acidovorax]|uniref:PLxRFG domain-containing protein n=1 Tax=unclassified Acidovorax TaxID=2684926 RepID=UPI001C484D93|nr:MULTISPECIES: PLxRFG domain-containing protein [unclassified Acidovorax]MBV7460605.1 PLxRFG domain-containing protein [Acidovorax sp. sif0632]MBV7465630.1 PLxRFG domain-containing protein [Acidovorax sp. sif0613]